MAREQIDRPALRLDLACLLESDKCSVCNDILRDFLNTVNADRPTWLHSAKLCPVREIGVDIYPDLPRLEHWAKKGCAMCKTLKAAALSPEASNALGPRALEGTVLVQIHVQYSLTSKNHLVDTGSKILTSLGISFSFSGFVSPLLRFNQVWPSVPSAFYIHFPIEQSKAPRTQDLVLGSLPETSAPSVLHGRSYQFIERAIDKCVASCDHSRASSLEQESFVPSRLVDVRSQHLRVVLGADLARTQSAVRYATLSYCWGPAPHQLMLTEAEEPLLTTGFSFNMLAPVQQDMVLLARALSIPYVWIDALCIRQGDRNDWVHEASLMDKIYSESFITICAVASTGCHEGFLKRDVTTIPFPRIESSLHDKGIEHSSPYVLHGTPSISKHGDTDLEDQLPHTPWAHRAWTFQEDVLSSRCLYLTKAGIRFRCSSFVWAESDEDSRLPRTRSPPQFRHLVRGDFEQAPDLKWLRQAWAVAVWDFSSRQITQRQDLLPALSGLARRFAVAFGRSGGCDGGDGRCGETIYAAGLWKPDLYRWLTWTLDNEETCPYQSLEDVLKDSCDLDTYVAPSWSWIGRRQAVNMSTLNDRGIPEIDTDYEDNDNVMITARVTEVVCEPCTVDGFGQIASLAMLMMETKVLHLGEAMAESGTTGVSLAHRPGTAPGKASSATLTINLSSDMPLEMHLGWQSTMAAVEETWKHFTLALVGYYTSEIVDEGQPVGGKCPYGLVLYRGEEDRPFIRIGIFYVPMKKVRASKVSWDHDAVFSWEKMETIKII